MSNWLQKIHHTASNIPNTCDINMKYPMCQRRWVMLLHSKNISYKHDFKPYIIQFRHTFTRSRRLITVGVNQNGWSKGKETFFSSSYYINDKFCFLFFGETKLILVLLLTFDHLKCCCLRFTATNKKKLVFQN